MKKIYTLILLCFIHIIFESCSTTIDYPILQCDEIPLTSNQTLQKVKLETNSIAQKYQFDDIIEAYVVSSDEGGNFFKTISCQTLATPSKPAIGFSIALDASNTYIDYRLGTKVYLKLKDQFLDIYHGSLRIGSIYEGNFGQSSVGRIAQNDYKNVLIPSCTIIDEVQLIDKITLTEALNEDRLNTLIELQDVQFLAEAVGRKFYEEANDTGGATNWALQDKSGSQIYFRTSSYANFSEEIVPEGSGNIKGIITKYGDDYQFLARYTSDIALNKTRVEPFFSENFKTVTENSAIYLPGWTNIVENGSLYWKGALSSGNGFAQYAITGTKVASNIGWLISPPINMDLYDDEVLTFRSAQDDLDVDSPLNSLQVLISNNFDGVNLNSATWIPLPAIVATQYQKRKEFIGSGPIDLSQYTGIIRIAFKYTGAGKDLALDGTFMIDDVEIFGK